MAFAEVKKYLEAAGFGDRVQQFTQSSATVAQAAAAAGCEPARIAKTMSFLLEGRAVLLVTAGDARVDNKKFKAVFHQKARMIPGEQVARYIGHEPGGVCPFAVQPGVDVYLDVALQRFETVYPAAGDDHSAVRLSPDELWRCASAREWVDVCSGWNAAGALEG